MIDGCVKCSILIFHNFCDCSSIFFEVVTAILVVRMIATLTMLLVKMIMMTARERMIDAVGDDDGDDDGKGEND